MLLLGRTDVRLCRPSRALDAHGWAVETPRADLGAWPVNIQVTRGVSAPNPEDGGEGPYAPAERPAAVGFADTDCPLVSGDVLVEGSGREWLVGEVRLALDPTGGEASCLDFDLFSTPLLDPTVVAVSPDWGTAAGGTAVTVTGAGFRAGAQVFFGGVPATEVTVVGDGSLTAKTGAGVQGTVDVVVRNTDGQEATLHAGYTYQTVASVPLNIRVTQGSTSDSIDVSWDLPASDGGSPVTGYTVNAYAVPTGGSVIKGTSNNTGARTGTITGLTPGTTYYVMVRARNAIGFGPPPDTRVEFALPPTTPTVPLNLRATTGTASGTIDVSWDAPASDGGSPITMYGAAAYAALTGGTVVKSLLAYVAGSGTGTIVNLTPGVTYYVNQRCRNVIGYGPLTDPRIPVMASANPASPTDVQAAPAASGSVTVSWTPPTIGTPITNYEAAAWTSAVDGSIVTATFSAETPTATLTGLTTGTTYWCTVRAMNTYGWGAWAPTRVQVVAT